MIESFGIKSQESSMVIRNHRLLIAISTLAMTSVLVLFGCSSKNTADSGATSNSNIVLTASPTSFENGETSVMEATVTVNGVALPNAVVRFTVSPTNAGYFSPANDTTDASGIAATVFTATNTGTVSVAATVEGTSITRSLSLAITQGGGSGGTGNVNITTSPSLLLANGADTATITIAVRDNLAQPAPDSTVVKICAGEKFVDRDGNGYWSQGIDSLVFDANANGLWDGIGIVPSTAYVTGGNGNAVVRYISGNDAYTVYIKVTVDDNGITGSGEVALQLSPNTAVNTLYLSSDSVRLVVKQAGGVETGYVRATAYDVSGNRVPEGIVINFVILDGPGGGERLGNTGYGPYASVTNSQGVAAAPLSSGTISGTVRIRAYSDTVLSNATQVLISAGPPAHIAVGAAICNIPAWGKVADNNKIVAVISDIYLNPVPDSTVAYFSCDEGTMQSHELRTKNGEGVVQTDWFSGNNVPTADGIVVIMVETAGGTVADTSFFINSWSCAQIFATGMPATMLANGTGKVTVTVTGLDLNGNFVVGATPFFASANYVTVGSGEFNNGCQSSSGQTSIFSSTLDVDNSLTGGNDNGIGAIDVVTFYTRSGASQSYNLQLLTGNAYRGTSSINVPGSVRIGQSVQISATIQDRWSNPLGDHTLVLSASAGAIVGASQETDAYGEADGFVWNIPNDTLLAGDQLLTITDTDPRGGIVITKTVSVTR